MWVILWWLLTVGESVWDSGDSCDYNEDKCGDKCVDLRVRSCECGGTNLTFSDIVHDGKYCCTDQTGAKQNCEIEMILTTII